jgi:hypothetical protein
MSKSWRGGVAKALERENAALLNASLREPITGGKGARTRSRASRARPWHDEPAARPVGARRGVAGGGRADRLA